MRTNQIDQIASLVREHGIEAVTAEANRWVSRHWHLWTPHHHGIAGTIQVAEVLDGDIDGGCPIGTPDGEFTGNEYELRGYCHARGWYTIQLPDNEIDTLGPLGPSHFED